mmetsp:Transcript_2859/g.8430  ORF Transcript_2859/g.8430 Transcript_2859/m.8430 type:complete len:220 (+) Transcript_2859:560-1219(+)
MKDRWSPRFTASPSGAAPKASATRLTSSFMTGPPAPLADAEPTSSWSKRAIQVTSGSSGASSAVPSTRDSRQTKHEARLSRRPPKTNSPCAPPRAGACASKRLRSMEAMSPSATPSRSATSAMSSGSCPPAKGSAGASAGAGLRRAERQRTGAMWVSLLGAKDARSSVDWRWMQSEGTRITGSCTERRRFRREPSAPFVSTRPPMPRSRSNQVCHRPPP